MKKIMISGTGSGAGKTTVTAALLSLMNGAQPFKCGPDFIDPMFHEFVTGRPSYNLDSYMLEEETMRFLFKKHAPENGICVLEGMMGLYDGLGHSRDNFSAAHISRVLNAPVVLVADGKKISTSIAAQIMGYKMFDPRVEIRGVIINRVGEGLYNHLKEAIQLHTGIPCVGYLPDDDSIAISERHLGLMQAQEISDLRERISRLKEIASKTMDVEKIMEMSRSFEVCCTENKDNPLENYFSGLKVGIAKDRAFSFYYADNIHLMEEAGMEITYFSSMNDVNLPDVDCLYLGGGYPEVYARELSENAKMLGSIKTFSEQGKLIYAECGGMMYLSSAVITTDGNEYKMASVFPHKVSMKERLNIKRFGYIDCKSPDGESVRAHEFHYSDLEGLSGKEKYYFDIQKPGGDRRWRCGFMKENTIAGYPHIHFYSNLEFFKSLFIRAKRCKDK
jgi:cobyrinic acid a,c-diamide synthase